MNNSSPKLRHLIAGFPIFVVSFSLDLLRRCVCKTRGHKFDGTYIYCSRCHRLQPEDE